MSLYARDRTTLGVFSLLSCAALLSLLFGTGWMFSLKARYSLAAQFVLLGLSLDALRAFYTRALNLLDPVTALSLVSRECQGYIHRTKDTVDRLVRAAASPLRGLRHSHILSRGCAFPSPASLGKVARSAGWGMARCFGPSRIARTLLRPCIDPYLLSAPHPALRAPFPTSWRRGRRADRLQLDDPCKSGSRFRGRDSERRDAPLRRPLAKTTSEPSALSRGEAHRRRRLTGLKTRKTRSARGRRPYLSAEGTGASDSAGVSRHPNPGALGVPVRCSRSISRSTSTGLSCSRIPRRYWPSSSSI